LIYWKIYIKFVNEAHAIGIRGEEEGTECVKEQDCIADIDFHNWTFRQKGPFFYQTVDSGTF